MTDLLTVPDLIPTSMEGLELKRCWTYRDITGSLRGYVARYDGSTGKTYRPFFKHSPSGKYSTGYPSDELRPLYGIQHWVSQEDSETLFIVEGEKCVDALHNLGLRAVTSPGGANAISKADWSIVQNHKEVIILPDNDEAGSGFAGDLPQILESIAPDVKVMIARLPNLPMKGDVVDYIQSQIQHWDGFSKIQTVDRESVLRQFRDDVASVAFVADMSHDSNRNNGPKKNGQYEVCRSVADVAGGISENVFPVDALGGVMAAATNALHKNIQAPLSLCAQSVLAAANLASQALVNVQVGGRPPIPITEFFLSVAKSGERKSTLDSIILKPIRDYQLELQEQYRRDYLEYTTQMKVYERKVKAYIEQEAGVSRKKNCGISIDRLTKPVHPVNPVLVISDMTLEGVQKHLVNGYPSVGVFSDEGGMIVGGYAMNPENILKSLAGFSNFWDNKPVSRLRAGDGITVLNDKRVSLHLMFQPMVASFLLGNDLASGQGFLSRCLVIDSISNIGYRPYNLDDISKDEGMLAYNEAMSRVVRTELPLRKNNTNELEPRILKLSKDAEVDYIFFYNHIEEQMQEGKQFEEISGFASKVAEHALRLAGTIAVFEDPDCTEISTEKMEAGIQIASFYIHENLRLLKKPRMKEEEYLRSVLYSWLQDKYPTESFTVRDIHRNGPPSVRKLKSEGIDGLLKAMISAEKVHPSKDKYILAHSEN